MSKKLTHIGDVALSKETAGLFMPPDTEPAEEAVRIIKRMQKAVMQKPAKSDPPAEEAPPPAAELADPAAYQLNLWSEPERGGPNPFLRSALFAAIQSEHREQIQGPVPANKTEPVPPGQVVTQKGLNVAYKGQQLDQYDLDVWLQAIHWARWQTTGAADCAFKGNSFLKELGRTGGKINYDLLNKSLTRLTEGLVVIKQGTVTFTGHLISSFIRDDDTRIYKLKFADEILNLFGHSTFTRLQWKERRALKGKALALWLHGFYSSHAKPYPLTIEYLHKLCGSRNTALKSFREALKTAFEQLERVTGMKATFEADTVTVERQPSGSQAKHLAKFLAPLAPPKQGQSS